MCYHCHPRWIRDVREEPCVEAVKEEQCRSHSGCTSRMNLQSPHWKHKMRMSEGETRLGCSVTCVEWPHRWSHLLYGANKTCSTWCIRRLHTLIYYSSEVNRWGEWCRCASGIKRGCCWDCAVLLICIYMQIFSRILWGFDVSLCMLYIYIFFF